MAKPEVLDEEPFDIDVDGDDELFQFNDDDSLEASDEEEETEAPVRKKKTQHLSDDDLDDYEDLKRRTEAAEAAAAAAVEATTRLAARGGDKSRADALGAQRKALSDKIADVRAKMKVAFEEADSDAHVDLSEEMADLKGQERLLTVIAEQEEARQKAPQNDRPTTHPKATAWVKKNQWFTDNEEARMAAVGYANTLEAQGITPASDEYYKKVDVHMRRRYPELFEEEEEAPRRRPATDAARPADRSAKEGGKGRRREVRLTPLQAKMAKQWGLPKEALAKEVLRQSQRDALKERN